MAYNQFKTKPTTSEQSIEQQKQEQQQLSEQDDSGEQMIAPRETWVQWKGLDMLEVPEKLMDRPEQLLRRVADMVSYNSDLRIPNWVAWKLAAERIEGITCIKYRALRKIKRCQSLEPMTATI
ncbi:hypothetical protein [Hoylesella shahii]|uniref:hypothetical protein n=1 Tax=Hoylesella shahii TaxID=228603 RepID=UPI0023A8D44E|nr:hypothetical protein [Hoylesella shahii]